MNILNLPGWEIISVANHEMQTEVTAKYTVDPTTCTKCGVVGGGFVKNGSYIQKVNDVPNHGKQLLLTIQRQRLRCRECKGVISQPIPDLDERGTMTKRAVDYIERQSFKDTFTRIANDVGVTEGTIRNVFGRLSARLESSITFETPEILGIDELQLLGKPRCILTNITESSIVGLLEDRKKDMVYRHLSMMPDRQRVKVVTMDMWLPYKDAVKAAMPQAVIVADKFHVVRMVDDAMDRVRKDLRQSASKKVGRGLMRAHWVLRRRRAKLNEKQTLELEAILGSYPTIKTVYELKERFHDIFDGNYSSHEARALYQAWEADIPLEMRPEFSKVTTAVNNWDAEVFAYFDHRYTNALTEAKNGLIKMVNRIGRGYSFDVIRARMLYDNVTLKPKQVPPSKEPKMHKLLHLSDFQDASGKPRVGMSITEVMDWIKDIDDVDQYEGILVASTVGPALPVDTESTADYEYPKNCRLISSM